MPASAIAGAVLAGGRSSRMGGRSKALATLAGRPLIQHVIERVEPQVDTLALLVESATEALDAHGLPQLPDPAPGHRGPLGGLLSALRHFASRYRWVLLVPCDAPFLPVDLATKLLAGAAGSALPGALAVYRGQPQPTFSIWHQSLLPRLESAVVNEGLGGFMQLIRTVRVAECDWQHDERSGNPPPFFNVNDEATLEEAQRWLRVAGESATQCSV
jgi:molybdopterin-guanine dinucleotide biosynthesis protein A